MEKITWNLIRQTFGEEQHTLTEGEQVTIGRAITNNITLSSIVISRNHCVLNVHNNKVVITDLNSSNGVYVGLKKIPSKTPYDLKDSDIVGIGWTIGAPLANINDNEKYVFKLVRQTPISSRIQFKFETEFDDAVENMVEVIGGNTNSPTLNNKLSLKRKIHSQEIKEEKKSRIVEKIVDLISDSDNENIKVEPNDEQSEKILSYKDKLKIENDDDEYEAFSVKQEYLGYNDEPIEIDSESDSESEHWYLRLSQSSPGKPFIKVSQDVKPEDSSYSQMDDFMPNLSLTNTVAEEEDFVDDPITILPQPPQMPSHTDSDDYLDDIISLDKRKTPITEDIHKHEGRDVVDGFSTKQIITQNDIQPDPAVTEVSNTVKKMQIIEPRVQKHHRKSKSSVESKKSSHHKKKHSSRRSISESQKEERKKKLKDIATKEKDCDDSSKNTSSNVVKPTTNVKITSTNRGAFLTDAVQIVKPVKRKDNDKKTKNVKSQSTKHDSKDSTITEDIENKNKLTDKTKEKTKHKKKHEASTTKSQVLSNESQDSRVPLKSLKPVTESDKMYSTKPFSKVEPLPPVEGTKSPVPVSKSKKIVRFSEKEPEIHEFEIEPGNNMKKTSLAKLSLVDYKQMRVFSLEKITLMKILRWNPQWLEEQINNKDPPPILGHNNAPMIMFQSFVNHNQYVQLVGDLLLMEIWECLSLAYMKLRNQNMNLIPMRIESLPPIPTQDRCFELYSLSVNISVLSKESNTVPRVGEIVLVIFGPEKLNRFFYVHNVRCLPSPPSNIHSFYSMSLHTAYTEKMNSLKVGDVLMGRTLAYINKELNLFEAMEYLAGSPLRDPILKPELEHFQRTDLDLTREMNSQWVNALNPSQQLAVASSVCAALGDKPSIQMVQGPPGTGKSSVICAIVMTYFYDEHGKRQQNRGKILICATSNAAVDELVIRLLKIRQSLPKSERFRMVRVGRAEAMHARARDVSSQQLAQRDAARLAQDPPQQPVPALHEELVRLEAKINMWRTNAQDAKDPVRVAYCQGRISELERRIALMRSSGGACDELRPDRLIATEKRIIEGADIVVTTLSSAQNHKMKGLKRRIALCIIDEAGQAIEPEALVPLTLDVTHLTLIGDPQQLPGYICSQRAKQFGLGESLFSRLAGCGGCVLLDRQYRMAADIADYPNRAFYGGRVAHHPPPRPALPLPPYAILAVASGDKGQGSCGANEIEACGVSRLVMCLNATLRPHAMSLAVITPYNSQKDLIKKYLKMLQDPNEPGVEVNTVDSFQGQERDVVVVSLARSRGVGFLTDAGRMNVMLTRARHALLICLNPHAMIKNHQWQTLVEDAQRRKMYRVLPNKVCQPISAGLNCHDEILKVLK